MQNIHYIALAVLHAVILGAILCGEVYITEYRRMAKVRNKYQSVVNGFAFERWASDIQSKRMRSGQTMQQVAVQVECSKATISRWERRLTMPSIADFLFVCALWDLDPMQYLSLEKPQAKTMYMFTPEVAKAENE